MKKRFSQLRNAMIEYKRNYNETHERVKRDEEMINITDEIPEVFDDITISAQMVNGNVKHIIFDIPCSVAQVIRSDLGEYDTFYNARGIYTDWQHIHHPRLEYEIKRVEQNSNRISLDVYIVIRCPKCGHVLNDEHKPFTFGKWFNIRNLDYYKQLLLNRVEPIDALDLSKIEAEIFSLFHDNLKPGDVLE